MIVLVDCWPCIFGFELCAYPSFIRVLVTVLFHVYMYSDLGVNFGLWFIFATPAMILALFCSWLYLSILYCDDRYMYNVG